MMIAEFTALNPLAQLLVILILLAVVSIALRFALHLARKVLTCGCLVILVLGGVFLILNATHWISF